ncbi:hypothetical protein [Plebeiibacterium sediminum]|uniref:Uncharacterized protein n=1 Tax=Plebeiibacterium sediminum TaxID=2992112 RepID=A0AAE3M6H3_9BACT|nr:hypothetical protein [Plebeiobacterium sediminum]MCW3788186.1 hypothetical protein [Plebeiobacterium sediminum]
MNITSNKSNVVLISSPTGITLISCILYISHHHPKNDLYQERIRNEMLLSEKMKLDENDSMLKDKVLDFSNKTNQQEDVIRKITNELMVKQNEINLLIKEKGTAAKLKNKLAEFEEIPKRLNEELKQKTIAQTI